MIVLFGGPAGAGKSTLARAWCATRERAVHVELDAVRELIVQGLLDPQDPGTPVEEQYADSVHAAAALVRAFGEDGYDVAVDDVLSPAAYDQLWRPRFEGLDLRVVIVLPTLEETLARSRARDKRVREEHTREQHVICSLWPPEYVVDTTGLSVEDSLALVVQLVD